MDPEDLAHKQQLQETEYAVPIHWQMGRVDTERYGKLSALIARKIAAILQREGNRKVRVIDVGCGDGAGSYQLWKALRDQGFDVRVEGYDYSERAIDWAKKQTTALADGTLSFNVGAAEESTYEPENDRTVIVLLREVIEHLTDAQIDGAFAALKSHFANPYLLLTTPSVNSPLDPKHLRHYTVAMLTATFERNGFAVREINGFGFRPRALYKPLVWLKTKLNYRPAVAWVASPMWAAYPPGLAMTLFGIGSASPKTDPSA